jgi:hypothetical protein
VDDSGDCQRVVGRALSILRHGHGLVRFNKHILSINPGSVITLLDSNHYLDPETFKRNAYDKFKTRPLGHSNCTSRGAKWYRTTSQDLSGTLAVVCLEMLDNILEARLMGPSVIGDRSSIVHNLDLVFSGMIGRGHGGHSPFPAGVGLQISMDPMPSPSGGPLAGHARSIKMGTIVLNRKLLRLYTMY